MNIFLFEGTLISALKAMIAGALRSRSQEFTLELPDGEIKVRLEWRSKAAAIKSVSK